MAAWRADAQPEARIELVEPGTLASTILDVRQRNEYDAGHVPGALHIELGSVSNATDQLPDGPITVMCGHGERAMSGASILAARGRREVSVLHGGPDDWADATGRPLE
jgi:rhodanese-related sulfurtransferase